MIDDLDLLLLRAPAGNGRQNHPDDIEALDRALHRTGVYAPPPEYAGGPQRCATAPMIEALGRFQEPNGLKGDGYADPGGPTERAINNRLLGKPKGAGLLFDPPPALTGTVGNGFANKREDVAAVQRMLGAPDYLPEAPFDRPAGFIDQRTTEATRRFQRDRGLVPDGWLAPGGETETAPRGSVGDLARVKAQDWFAFAERAGKAQARMIERTNLRAAPTPNGNGKSDAAPSAEPVKYDPRDWGWPGRRLAPAGRDAGRVPWRCPASGAATRTRRACDRRHGRPPGPGARHAPRSLPHADLHGPAALHVKRGAHAASERIA